MPSKSWSVPAAVLVTCVPCLLIPVTAGLIAGGAFSGALGLLGVPWILALALAVPMSLAVALLRMLRRSSACEMEEDPGRTSTSLAETDVANARQQS